MTIDISKINPGDKVTLSPLEVTGVNPVTDLVGIKLYGPHARWVHKLQIAAHHPAPREIGVGDRVRTREFTGDWYVEHIANKQVWIRQAGHERGWLMALEKLTLVEGDQ